MVRRPSLHWLSAKVTVHGKGQECHGSGLWAAHSPSSPGPGLMSQDTPTDPLRANGGQGTSWAWAPGPSTLWFCASLAKPVPKQAKVVVLDNYGQTPAGPPIPTTPFPAAQNKCPSGHITTAWFSRPAGSAAQTTSVFSAGRAL